MKNKQITLKLSNKNENSNLNFKEIFQKNLNKLFEGRDSKKELMNDANINIDTAASNVNKINKSVSEEKLLNNFIDTINTTKLMINKPFRLFTTTSSERGDDRDSNYWFKVQDDSDDNKIKKQLAQHSDLILFKKIIPTIPILCLHYSKIKNLPGKFVVMLFVNGDAGDAGDAEENIARLDMFNFNESELKNFEMKLDTILYQNLNVAVNSYYKKYKKSNLLAR